MRSACCSTATRSAVTSPRMRTARPGPGKGWRRTKVSGRPSSRPSARTSSLNSSRSGSTRPRFIRSGRPPTLWWDLMVTRRPLERHALDHVRVERALGQEARRRRACCASASKTSMKVPPMILRLRSGSVTPASLPRNRSAGVDVDQRDVEVAAEQVDHLLRLAVAQQAGVDEDAGELVADRLVHEQGGDRRIDAAREAADHAGRRPPARARARSACAAVGLASTSRRCRPAIR